MHFFIKLVGNSSYFIQKQIKIALNFYYLNSFAFVSADGKENNTCRY